MKSYRIGVNVFIRKGTVKEAYAALFAAMRNLPEGMDWESTDDWIDTDDMPISVKEIASVCAAASSVSAVYLPPSAGKTEPSSEPMAGTGGATETVLLVGDVVALGSASWAPLPHWRDIRIAELEREVARLTAERDEADNIVRAVHAWLVSDPVDDVRSVLAFADLEAAVTAYVDAKGGLARRTSSKIPDFGVACES